MKQVDSSGFIRYGEDEGVYSRIAKITNRLAHLERRVSELEDKGCVKGDYVGNLATEEHWG